MNEIDFYKINETLNNKYYQIPQELFVNRLYKEKLNSDSKILYAFLLDRLSLSQKNHWFDKEGRVYLIFTREEVQNKLCLSEKTVTKAFKQLIDVNLIAEKREYKILTNEFFSYTDNDKCIKNKYILSSLKDIVENKGSKKIYIISKASGHQLKKRKDKPYNINEADINYDTKSIFIYDIACCSTKETDIKGIIKNYRND